MMEFRLSASMISCLICLRLINIGFHNTNFRLMGDYKKYVEAFDAFIKSKDTNRNEGHYLQCPYRCGKRPCGFSSSL